MIIDELMEEYGLDLNDVRWYLCSQIANNIVNMAKIVDDITAYLWSGKIESELYNIEELYLENLKKDLKDDVKTETEIRDIFAQIFAVRDRKIKHM